MQELGLKKPKIQATYEHLKLSIHFKKDFKNMEFQTEPKIANRDQVEQHSHVD